MATDGEVCCAIVNNIPKVYHACDLRNFFSQFLETKGFFCFHFRHRPEVQRPTEAGDKSNLSRCVTTCCVIKVYESRFMELMKMYHRKHWVNRQGNTLPIRCFIKKIIVHDAEVTPTNTDKPKDQVQLQHISEDREIFTKADLVSLIEMRPPLLMPNGNVGTPTIYFLDQIKACRLPPSIITKLKLEFPKLRAKRLFGCVDYDYGGHRKKSKPRAEENWFTRTFKGHIISDTYDENQEQKQDNDEEELDDEEEEDEEEEESEEEEWDRHETLHEDVTSQERLKERLFEEKIELKWEKGGSGLVFYTDAQYWDQLDGDFDAKTSDDWDVDTSAYYEPGCAGDKDSRDLLKMRLEERLRNGNHPEKVDANDFAGFEKYSRGFGRKLMESQGWQQGQGIGKRSGRSEPVFDIGQHPRDKKGFGYRGEKLKRQIGPQPRQRRRRHNRDDDDDDHIRISTIYDNPHESDPPESLLRSSFLTKLKYRQEFLKGKWNECN